MAAAADSRVDVQPTAGGGEHRDDLVGEDRHVEGHQMPSPAIASANRFGSSMATR